MAIRGFGSGLRWAVVDGDGVAQAGREPDAAHLRGQLASTLPLHLEPRWVHGLAVQSNVYEIALAEVDVEPMVLSVFNRRKRLAGGVGRPIHISILGPRSLSFAQRSRAGRGAGARVGAGATHGSSALRGGIRPRAPGPRTVRTLPARATGGAL